MNSIITISSINSDIAKEEEEMLKVKSKTCWALIEEEAKVIVDFFVCKSIGTDRLAENLLGLWVKDGSVALGETKPSIFFLKVWFWNSDW